MGVKSTKADTSKRSLSYNIVNTIGDNNLRALKRPNKGKKNIMATFLRIKVIKLKDWFYWVGVPVNSLRCEYG